MFSARNYWFVNLYKTLVFALCLFWCESIFLWTSSSCCLFTLEQVEPIYESEAHTNPYYKDLPSSCLYHLQPLLAALTMCVWHLHLFFVPHSLSAVWLRISFPSRDSEPTFQQDTIISFMFLHPIYHLETQTMWALTPISPSSWISDSRWRLQHTIW